MMQRDANVQPEYRSFRQFGRFEIYCAVELAKMDRKYRYVTNKSMVPFLESEDMHHERYIVEED